MKKQVLTMAMAAAMALPWAAQAGDAAEAKWYGRVHVGINKLSDTELQLDTSGKRANNIGVKGSMPANFPGLTGLKAIYKLEAGYNMDKSEEKIAEVKVKTSGGFIRARDTWLGMKSKTLGTLRTGTIITSYKQTGKAVDPLFTTAAEGRGHLGMMSSLHGGTGDAGQGRATRTVRYDSPDLGGAKIIAAYTLRNGAENNIGLGVHYKNGPILAFIDYLDVPEGDGLSAVKVGAKYSASGVTVAGHYEIDDGLVSGDTDGEGNILFLSAGYKMGATQFVLDLGIRDESKNKVQSERTAWAIAVKQKVSKTALAYLGYGMIDEDDFDKNDSVITAGMVVSF